jgi:nicotinamide-nucleotide amidase
METAITQLLEDARQKGIKIVTVESCTGGLIGMMLTDRPGASHAYERGFITYSNEAKMELVGVPHRLIKDHGAVSEPVARAMAEGGITYSRANLAISVTGVAGPSGGTKEKPVGLVYISLAWKNGQTECLECHFKGSRDQIRKKAAEKAIQMLISAVERYRLSA